jgi:hypothetical protein
MFIFPAKAHPVLIVHANTVLSLTVAVQFLKAIAWWISQVFKHRCKIDSLNLSDSHPGNISKLPASSG